MKIKKRDGRVVPFDQNKIIDAILKAFKSVDGDLSDYAYIKAGNIADYILETCKEYKREQCAAGSSDCYLDVEQIQDLVECQRWKDNKIKVDGKWYDNEGYYLKDAEEAETDQLLLDSSCERSECELEGKLKAIDKVAQNAYDYLWLIAIVGFMGEK